MRAVVQRVREAGVTVDGRRLAAIGAGLMVLLGIGHDDDAAAAIWMADKLAHLRIFENAERKFDRSVRDVGGSVLLVSQFTLYADTRKGRRPSFSDAARPEQAAPLCNEVATLLRTRGVAVATGEFGARMQVDLINDGPVTVWLDSAAR
ncbi:MAG TPA: D-aminoacyl-tRNA deacylase [Candidatus Kryptonia bacterium]|nr:D-aminoacyl-tRNA deacylase [Candidatus Kryptonia bacterium]